MKIRTTRFGDMEFEETAVITMKGGLIGFEGIERFVIVDHNPGSPFEWLQAVDEPSLAFVIMDPSVINVDFSVNLSGDIVEELEIEKGEDVTVRVIVTIPEDPRDMRVNLRAPLLINMRNLAGKQVVLADDRIPVRYPIVDRSACDGGRAVNCTF